LDNTQTTEQAGDIRDIKGLEHFSYSPLYYIVPALLVAALLYFAWRLYKKRMAKIKVETIAPPPPDEVALRELGNLRQKEKFNELGEKLFNFRLSEVFRNYLEGRFDFPASDMTTEEISSILPTTPDFDSTHAPLINKILNETDKVKFAKHHPGKNVALGLVENATEFVDETKEKEINEV
jgi:hypothetical protein